MKTRYYLIIEILLIVLAVSVASYFQIADHFKHYSVLELKPHGESLPSSYVRIAEEIEVDVKVVETANCSSANVVYVRSYDREKNTVIIGEGTIIEHLQCSCHGISGEVWISETEIAIVEFPWDVSFDNPDIENRITRFKEEFDRVRLSVIGINTIIGLLLIATNCLISICLHNKNKQDLLKKYHTVIIVLCLIGCICIAIMGFQELICR